MSTQTLDLKDVVVVDKLQAPQIRKLHHLYQNEWFSKGRELEEVTKMLEHTDFVFGFCKKENNELIGFARVISDSVYKAFVFDVIVDPEYRVKGLGHFIMETIFDHPVLKIVQHIELYCPEKFVSFYESMNFKKRTSILLRRDQT